MNNIKTLPPTTESTEEKCEVIEGVWGNVTDPNEHNPKKYRYLIHGINPIAKISSSLISTLNMQEHKPSSYEGNQSINLLNNPEKIAERVTISCSLIDQEHWGTWGDVGLKLGAPEGNVIMADNKDMGAAVGNKEVLKRQASQRENIPKPDDLIRNTGPQSYNEIVLLANENGENVKLMDFFYKTLEDGSPKDPNLYYRIKYQSEKLNLPLVPITEPNPYKEDKIFAREGVLKSVQYQGRAYRFDAEEHGLIFRYIDQKELPYHFPSPDKIRELIDYLKSQGVGEGLTKSLLEKNGL